MQKRMAEQPTKFRTGRQEKPYPSHQQQSIPGISNAYSPWVVRHSQRGALPVAVSVLSGTACVCTRQVTAQLSERTSLLTGTWFSYFTGSVVAVAALGIAALAGAEPRLELSLSAPAWAYLGGVLGAAAVYLQSICVKRMSSVAMTLVMFAGQVFGGAAIDAAFYGEFSGETLIGGALAFAGLVLNALAARKKGA